MNCTASDVHIFGFQIRFDLFFGRKLIECQIDLARLEELERRLLKEINPEQDCLRLYRLADSRGCEVREFGAFKATDFDGPLVI